MIIEILDYPLPLRLGYYDEERLAPQTALVSMWVTVKQGLLAGEKDELDLTVDYGALARLLDEQIAGCEIRLIESVINMIGREVLARFPIVGEVEVKLEKRVIPHEVAKGAKISIREVFIRES